MDLSWLVVVLFLILVVLVARRIFAPQPELEATQTHRIGDITAETLSAYCGYDYSKPILVAIRGVVYDVTQRSDLYGPGKTLHVYAGKEISRALALGSVQPDDVDSGQLMDLGEEAMQRLEQQVQEMKQQHGMLPVGQVVALREMTLQQLSSHDGTHPELPLCLAIQGVVYDITKGKQFYGPDGVYPFAGRECARAFALMSTEISDCNANVEDLSPTELETMRDWKAKFNVKYPIVGKIVPGKQE